MSQAEARSFRIWGVRYQVKDVNRSVLFYTQHGGWNRLVLQVNDLPGCVAAMKKAGLRFRNEIEVGPSGKQIQLEDPDGNAIELFEPAQR